MKEAYLIEGMTCSSCEKAVQSAVRSLHGVDSAVVSLSDSAIDLDYNPSQITVDEIRKVIGRLGYTLADKKPGPGQRSHDPVG